MNWRAARSPRPFGVVLASVLSLAAGPGLAQDMNSYVLKAVQRLAATSPHQGYDINAAFTQNLRWGPKATIPATNPPKTMCVAAVAEVIVTAISIYAAETGDNSVFTTIPVTAWTKGGVLSLRANIFMYEGTGSRGTGYTLAEFGLGEERRFPDLKPGDFINLNRTSKSGHAVVFTGFIRPDGTISPTYSPDVVGFNYFSAQGKGKPDEGLAYRNAYFDGNCPGNSAVPRDCGVIKSSSRVLLNAGRLWDPKRWGYQQAIVSKTSKTRSIFEDQNPEATRGVIDAFVSQELEKELPMKGDYATFFDGETTD